MIRPSTCFESGASDVAGVGSGSAIPATICALAPPDQQRPSARPAAADITRTRFMKLLLWAEMSRAITAGLARWTSKRGAALKRFECLGNGAVACGKQ